MSYLLEEAPRVLADLHEAWDDVVEIDVTERGVVPALPLHLVEQEIPAVHWGQHILILPRKDTKQKQELDRTEVHKPILFKMVSI